ncbi:MAG: hypothetical protein AAGC55_01850, partial [Myxococcota bacterium]
MDIATAEFDSPLGPLFVAATAAGLCAMAFADRCERIDGDLARRFGTRWADSVRRGADRVAAEVTGSARGLSAEAPMSDAAAAQR